MMSQPMNTVIKKELDKQVPIEAVTQITDLLSLTWTASVQPDRVKTQNIAPQVKHQG
jgi:hypothetical protein